MVDQEKRGRGGDVRKAPSGFLLAHDAYKRLGMSKQTFYERVRDGTITKVTLPGERTGYYREEDIELLAVAREEALIGKRLPPTAFRVATPEDAQGIYDVIRSLGWTATPPEIRREWYSVNPEIDWVVTPPNSTLIMGYISAVPYYPSVMEKMMTGSIKGKDIRSSDIQRFESGHEYDVFVGLAERVKTKGSSQYAQYGARLIMGFRHVIWEWASRGIYLHRLMAHSAEEDGQKFANLLKFDHVEAVSGDLYPRYIFDFHTSATPFAKRYRQAWKH